MVEINCNKCKNLIDKTAGCKLYGADPAEAVKSCRANLFMNYCPEEKEPPKFTPGATVWVLERDEYGEPIDVSGHMFLAEVCGAVIVTPYVYGCEGLGEALQYFIEQTVACAEIEMSVFPAADCYTNKADAEATFKAGSEG